MKLATLLTLALSTLTASSALATPIRSASDPALGGATRVDFEAETVGVYYAYMGGYTTHVGGVNFYAARLYVDANRTVAGLYNTTGAKYLTNGSATQSLNITFPATVKAFGFNFGASDISWTLTAYNAAGAVIETLTILPTRGSNAGDFFGIAAANIASVTLRQNSGLRVTDVVFFDNLTFARQ